MHISQIHFANFRNFSSLDLKVDQGLIILSGVNGAGKTNFLEGIYFAATLRRFPDSQLRQLVKLGEEYFRINLGVGGAEAELLEVFWQNKSTGTLLKLALDKLPATRIKYAGVVPAVSFLPQDLSLLTRSPQNRRRYLDETLMAASAFYRAASIQYERALRQRNSLWGAIAVGRGGEADLEIWDEQLAENGSVITKMREDFLASAQEVFPEILGKLSPAPGKTELVYVKGGASGSEEFRVRLREARVQERLRLTTLVGPHRDDFEVLRDNQSVAGFLSRGQIRALTLALKIFQRWFLDETLGRPPILLLDDVFSEFDEAHQRIISAFLQTFPQVFLTSANPETLKNFPRPNQAFSVEAENIRVSS